MCPKYWPLLYYRISDNIICMGLLGVLFKTSSHRRLAELLWVEDLTASIHALSKMSELPYATCHEFLHKMERMGLVQKTKEGRAVMFSSKVTNEELKPLRALLKTEKNSKNQSLSEFPEMDLHLVGEFPEFKKEKAQSREELLVKVVVLAKRNSSLLRTMPLLVKRLGPSLDVRRLSYWSKLYHVDRELGFLLDLTGKLSEDRRLTALAKKFFDKRWGKDSIFLEKEHGLSGFQAQLLEQNTPELAKKWFLKMNMGLDSFESMFRKFA